MDRIAQEAQRCRAVVKLAERKGQSFVATMHGVSLSSVKRCCNAMTGTWQSLLDRPHSHPVCAQRKRKR